jgi:RNA polymerase sigma-70 factor (ECF subfamily)
METESSDEQDARDMARLVSGQDTALNDLMQRHGERLFRYLIRQLQDESDAAEFAQEAFVRVYQNRERYRKGARFSTWLYTIATNLVRDRFRWRARHPQVSLDAESSETGASIGETLSESRPGPDGTMQVEERARMVRRAVAALPEDLRDALLLSEYEDRSNAEVAEILGCSVKAVESRLFRARQQLKQRLQRELAT